MERDLLLTELRQQLLGPREGHCECLDDVDYLVGFLNPPDQSKDDDFDDEFIPNNDGSGDDYTDPGDHVVIGSTFDGKPPSSLGISFIIRGEEPTIDICATWARYRKVESENYRREPRHIMHEAVPVIGGTRRKWELNDDVELSLRTVATQDRIRVTLFLVNRSTEATPFTERRVHQPQIRVNIGQDSELDEVSSRTRVEGDDEEDSLRFLYRHRKALARGHLVSATWKSIDPERFLPPDEPCAHTWIDAETLPEDQRELFTCPDLRTEYLPALSIESPNLDSWAGFSQESPLLSSDEIADIQSGEALYDSLRPLSEGYSNWLNMTETAALEELDGGEEEVVSRHMTACRASLERLEAGLVLLRDNDNVRAAFQFANRAIHQANQPNWKETSRAFKWRPFQMAFFIMNLNGLSDRNHPDREICDILWFPTGGGKTEAYLGLAAFTMALRRLVHPCDDTGFIPGAGVSVISRYTLRLLTIQQFRRATSLITSCERLRVLDTPNGLGWRPQGCGLKGDSPWGGASFSIGLWVGGTVTPNKMHSFRMGGGDVVYGAIRGGNARGLLNDSARNHAYRFGDPAQILNCPACGCVLSLSQDGLSPDEEVDMHLTLKSNPDQAKLTELLDEVHSIRTAVVHSITPIKGNSCTLHLTLTPESQISPNALNGILWNALRETMDTQGGAFHCFDATRPGYFPLTEDRQEVGYSIICPNHDCALNDGVQWHEITPAGERQLPEVFENLTNRRCPIPALTVDEEIYARCPSMVISTIDKFARLPFDPQCGNLFGAIEAYHPRRGYVRDTLGIYGDGFALENLPDQADWIDLRDRRFAPPDFILQDELHLIDGPLGSIVGLYEIAIKELTKIDGDLGAKYIASTATARSSKTQVSSLYGRDTEVFPPPGVDIDDSFWARHRRLDPGEIPAVGSGVSIPNPLEEDVPGRLYIGLCPIGQSMKWTLLVSWAVALQHIHERELDGAPVEDIDPYWTLVGYFNAIRELASAQALVGQDVVGRIGHLSERNGTTARDISNIMDLSSRIESVLLPSKLRQLEEIRGFDVVLTTSMFGTGVDIDRLGLMFVAGQPKTTSSYIQATGRVGRSRGGLIVTTLRAARPRDLNHFEFFNAYHNALFRYVEPVSVQPFSPNAVTRVLGPIMVALLRQADNLGGIILNPLWRTEGYGELCWLNTVTDEETASSLRGEILSIIHAHNQNQPDARRMAYDELDAFVRNGLHRWRHFSDRHGTELLFHEPTLNKPPESPVVLGSEAHRLRGLDEVFPNAPNSMRDVESTLNFKSREDHFPTWGG